MPRVNLSHNKNNGYPEKNAPVGEMVGYYTYIENLKIPQGIIKLAVPVVFLGNVETPKHHNMT